MKCCYRWLTRQAILCSLCFLNWQWFWFLYEVLRGESTSWMPCSAALHLAFCSTQYWGDYSCCISIETLLYFCLKFLSFLVHYVGCCCDSSAALLLSSVVQVEEVCDRSRVVPQVLHCKLRRMALTGEQMCYRVWCHSTLRTNIWYAAGDAGLVTVHKPSVTRMQLHRMAVIWVSWLGGKMDVVSDFRSSSCGFDSRSGCYRVAPMCLLSLSGIIWYWLIVGMLCDHEGNRRSSITLAMCHRLSK